MQHRSATLGGAPSEADGGPRRDMRAMMRGMGRDGLTTNRELYCAARMRGLTQRAAYREAYPRSASWKDSSVDAKACELESDGKVSERLAELRAEAARKAVATRAEVLSAQAAVLRKGVQAVDAAPLDAVPVAVNAMA